MLQRMMNDQSRAGSIDGDKEELIMYYPEDHRNYIYFRSKIKIKKKKRLKILRKVS
jgi:hypothetical protein